MSTEAAQVLDSKPPALQEKGEGVVTDGAPLPAKEERVSGKLEVLIRREQQARLIEKRAADREAALDAKLKAFEEREARLNEFESKKKNPKEALGLLGLTYDEITQAQLNDGELPPQLEIKRLREEIEAFKQASKDEKNSEKERQIEDAKKQAETQEKKAIDEFKNEINNYINENKERYELTTFEGAQELVFDVVDEYYNRTLAKAQKDFELGEITESQVVGKIMPMKEAADKVEEHLEQKYNKAKELSKTKTLWGAMPKDVKKEIAKQQIRPTTPPRTLTNQLSANASQPKAPRVLTDQERVQKAVAYARGLRP